MTQALSQGKLDRNSAIRRTRQAKTSPRLRPVAYHRPPADPKPSQNDPRTHQWLRPNDTSKQCTCPAVQNCKNTCNMNQHEEHTTLHHTPSWRTHVGDSAHSLLPTASAPAAQTACKVTLPEVEATIRLSILCAGAGVVERWAGCARSGSASLCSCAGVLAVGC